MRPICFQIQMPEPSICLHVWGFCTEARDTPFQTKYGWLKKEDCRFWTLPRGTQSPGRLLSVKRPECFSSMVLLDRESLKVLGRLAEFQDAVAFPPKKKSKLA